MSANNTVILTGRLTCDPQLRSVKHNKTLTTLSLAVRRPGKDPEGNPNVGYIEVTAARLHPTVEVAAYYAGHSTRELGDIDNTTTRIYQHPTGEHREAALAAIGQYIDQLEISPLLARAR